MLWGISKGDGHAFDLACHISQKEVSFQTCGKRKKSKNIVEFGRGGLYATQKDVLTLSWMKL